MIKQTRKSNTKKSAEIEKKILLKINKFYSQVNISLLFECELQHTILHATKLEKNKKILVLKALDS